MRWLVRSVGRLNFLPRIRWNETPCRFSIGSSSRCRPCSKAMWNWLNAGESPSTHTSRSTRTQRSTSRNCRHGPCESSSVTESTRVNGIWILPVAGFLNRKTNTSSACRPATNVPRRRLRCKKAAVGKMSERLLKGPDADGKELGEPDLRRQPVARRQYPVLDGANERIDDLAIAGKVRSRLGARHILGDPGEGGVVHGSGEYYSLKTIIHCSFEPTSPPPRSRAAAARGAAARACPRTAGCD